MIAIKTLNRQKQTNKKQTETLDMSVNTKLSFLSYGLHQKLIDHGLVSHELNILYVYDHSNKMYAHYFQGNWFLDIIEWIMLNEFIIWKLMCPLFVS